MKSFEERLQRLESISNKIRSGETALEEATSLFEEGIMLAKGLEKELSSVEGKIEKLIKEPSANGEPAVLDLFPELDRPEIRQRAGQKMHQKTDPKQTEKMNRPHGRGMSLKSTLSPGYMPSKAPLLTSRPY